MEESTESFYQCPPSPAEGRDAHVSCLEYDMVHGRKKLSVVVPLYNEKDNILEVVEDLEKNLKMEESEIILVDDGSTDGTLNTAHLLQTEYPNVRVVSHSVNLGKSAAMMTGFQQVTGDYVILMDGDGQFRASDIPPMIEQLERGWDVVNGWGEKKEPISKIIPSRIYNSICRRLFSLPVHQFNLGFKAFRREVVKDIFLKKDEHRYILPLLKNKGCTITEVSVDYLPRKNGRSKYGVLRIPCGILDMISLKMELLLGDRPFRLFGFVSLGLMALAGVLGLHVLSRLMRGSSATPLNVALCVILLLSGINLLALGYAVEAVKYRR